MIYDKESVAAYISANVKNLDSKILKQHKSQDQSEEALKNFNHLVSWKNLNINSLKKLGYISPSEMEKYNQAHDYLFTPEIRI